ncbi:MAG: monofunctional biosynthetic peptidoglycan transglycosylase [Chlorobiaceae bacterium]|nr:monofunctional biosynthetic peptidoglycan transglycosylase [Chlorobiaceae bacterium]
MKLARIISSILLLWFVADIARYFVYPDVGRLVDENPAKTAFMEYREAEWKREGLIDKKIDQKWVSLDHVSQNLIKAVLIAEDDKFWQHEGFDYQAIERAIEKNILAKKFKMGGSTISQQLAKNLFLSPSKNPVRKIKEAIITWRLEKTLSKRRILELYVNVAEWGDGIFGIGRAARHYYGVSAASLSARQASKLAAILPNPILYSPKGSSRYVRNRSNIIYAIMRKRGIVVPDYKEVITLTPDTTAVDSVVIGVPEYLLDQAISSDSSGVKDSKDDEAKPSPKIEEPVPVTP